MAIQSDEFDEILQVAEESASRNRPLMSHPPRLVASSKFIREVQHAFDITDDQKAREAADWVPYKGALGLRNLAVNDPATTARILAQIGQSA